MSERFVGAKQKISRWIFNGPFGKSLTALIDLQMWCFGCDIRRREGNLLLEYGFTRESAGAIYGSSHYKKCLGGDRVIHLWGFAVVACDCGSGLSLRRYQSTPLYADRVHLPSGIHRPHDLPDFSAPQTPESRQKALALMLIMTQGFANYESFVTERTPPQYRTNCIGKRRLPRALNGTSLQTGWTEVTVALHKELQSLDSDAHQLHPDENPPSALHVR